MKEASGELSMTAVAVVAIAAVGVLFTTVIWPNIKSSIQHNQRCSASYGCTCNSGESTCSCFYDEGEKTKQPITCDNPESKTKAAA